MVDAQAFRYDGSKFECLRCGQSFECATIHQCPAQKPIDVEAVARVFDVPRRLIDGQDGYVPPSRGQRVKAWLRLFVGPPA